MRRSVPIQELVQSGKLKIGDFINYRPTACMYIPAKENMGVRYDKPLYTDFNCLWRVREIDFYGKKLIIEATKILNENSLIVSSIVGFCRGPQEIHKCCEKLYSNDTIKAIARSILLAEVVDDGYIRIGRKYYYAYYYEKPKKLEYTIFNEKKYTNVSFRPDAKFYVSDGGGKAMVDKNGLVYRVPTSKEPVFVSEELSFYNT